MAALFGELRQAHPEKPMVAALMAGEAAMHIQWKKAIESVGVPAYTSPERALRAIGALWKYKVNTQRTGPGVTR